MTTNKTEVDIFSLYTSTPFDVYYRRLVLMRNIKNEGGTITKRECVMFDPRTDLPEIIEGDFREVTIQEHYQALIDEAKTTMQSCEYQRRLIDEMVVYIEENLIDELTDMGDVDSFVFLGTNLLELRLMSNAKSYRVREQACREVWFKYNH